MTTPIPSQPATPAEAKNVTRPEIGSSAWFGAVSVVLTMHRPDGSISIMNQISQITAPSKEAAIGAAITRAMKDLPGHQVHVFTTTEISLPNDQGEPCGGQRPPVGDPATKDGQ